MNRTEPGPPLLIHCRRFQVDEPIVARSVGWPERARRWCRRNPAPALSVAAVTVTMCLETVVSMTFAIAARTKAGRCRRERDPGHRCPSEGPGRGHSTSLSRMSPSPFARNETCSSPNQRLIAIGTMEVPLAPRSPVADKVNGFFFVNLPSMSETLSAPGLENTEPTPMATVFVRCLPRRML